MVDSERRDVREGAMAKKQSIEAEPRRARYEFRVWGEHRKVRKKLTRMASEETTQQVEDCYLIIDDPSWNAKVRDNTLKVKHLVAENKGFEQWSRDKHRSSKTTPSPFDELFKELRLDRPQRGKSFNLAKAVAKLDPDSGVRAVFVTKDRRRYKIGELRAEVTDITIHESGEVLRTLSFEGDSLKELVRLRKALGVKKRENLAVHQAIENEVNN